MTIRKKIITVLLVLCVSVMSVFAQEIHKAASEDDIAKIKAILEKDPALVNSRNKETETPLHIAAGKGNVKIVEFLIAKGADLNAQTSFDFTPLHIAAMRGQKEVAELLILKGSKVNAKDRFTWTPLHRAASMGHEEVVGLFVTKGADINIKTDSGDTPLYRAVLGGHKKTAELLIENGADKNIRKVDGETPLHAAAKKGNTELAELLIAKGIGVNVLKRYNLTPLHMAAAFGHEATINLLLEKGADINMKDSNGGAPIHLARACKREDIVELLLAHGADNSPRDFPVLKGEYLGMKKPGLIPELFAPEIFKDLQDSHSSMNFSPDGNEVYWSPMGGTIWYMKQENHKWTPPQIAPFSGKYNDSKPSFSQDGKRLFFTSNRPVDKNGKAKRDRDIWFLEKKENGWGEPQHLGSPVNTEKNEFSPSVSNEGTLYFRGMNYEGTGGINIYVSKSEKGYYTKPENIGDSIKSEYSELSPCIAADESYLIFASDRPGGYSRESELFISFRKKDKTWTKAKNMGKIINAGGAYGPKISPDGKFLFFFSRRSGITDYYWMDANIIDKLKPDELKLRK